MSGSEADKASLDLRNFSLRRIKLDGRRRRLDIGACMRTGASLTFRHRRLDGLTWWFWSMSDGVHDVRSCGIDLKGALPLSTFRRSEPLRMLENGLADRGDDRRQ